MARKEESGSGPHCEGPRVSEKDQSKEGRSQPQEQTRREGTQESTEWDRIPPLFQGKMPLLAPQGWEARLGDLLQSTEQGSVVKDCI